jgi:hypothetical protein
MWCTNHLISNVIILFWEQYWITSVRSLRYIYGYLVSTRFDYLLSNILILVFSGRIDESYELVAAVTPRRRLLSHSMSHCPVRLVFAQRFQLQRRVRPPLFHLAQL